MAARGGNREDDLIIVDPHRPGQASPLLGQLVNIPCGEVHQVDLGVTVLLERNSFFTQ